MMSSEDIIIFTGVRLLDIKKGSDWQELAAKLFCLGFFALLVYLLFKYAFAAFFPFLIAYLVSLLINPLSSTTAKRTGIPKKLCAAIYVTLAIEIGRAHV